MGIPYREQEAQNLCAVCKTQTQEQCLRCGLPLCLRHVPRDDERCDSCENDWLAISAGREFGQWRLGSRALLKTAKWSPIVGCLGVGLATLLAFISPMTLFTLWWLPALLLLGFPICIGSLVALPIARTTERALDSDTSGDRRKFLETREYAALPAPQAHNAE